MAPKSGGMTFQTALAIQAVSHLFRHSNIIECENTEKKCFLVSFDNMQPYFKKFEHWVAPMDGHDASGEYNASLHGTSGPVGVTVSNFNYPGHTEIIAAAGEVLSPHFDFKQDVDSGNMLGLGWAQMNQGVSKFCLYIVDPNFRG